MQRVIEKSSKYSQENEDAWEKMLEELSVVLEEFGTKLNRIVTLDEGRNSISKVEFELVYPDKKALKFEGKFEAIFNVDEYKRDDVLSALRSVLSSDSTKLPEIEKKLRKVDSYLWGASDESFRSWFRPFSMTNGKSWKEQTGFTDQEVEDLIKVNARYRELQVERNEVFIKSRYAHKVKSSPNAKNRRPNKILIYARGGGGGHHSPAKAFANYLDTLGFNAEIIDDFEISNKISLKKAIGFSYEEIYNLVFQQKIHPKTGKSLDELQAHYLEEVLTEFKQFLDFFAYPGEEAKRIREDALDPEVLKTIDFSPYDASREFINGILAAGKPHLRMQTDFTYRSPRWLGKMDGMPLLLSDQIKTGLITPDQIGNYYVFGNSFRVMGAPTEAVLMDSEQILQEKLRRNINPSFKIFAIVLGSQGKTMNEVVIRELRNFFSEAPQILDKNSKPYFVLLPGKNDKLMEQVQDALGDEILGRINLVTPKEIGFSEDYLDTSDMNALYNMVDAVIGKAGGATTIEAYQTHTPFVLIDETSEVEKYNPNLLRDAGLLVRPEPESLERLMKQNKKPALKQFDNSIYFTKEYWQEQARKWAFDDNVEKSERQDSKKKSKGKPDCIIN